MNSKFTGLSDDQRRQFFADLTDMLLVNDLIYDFIKLVEPYIDVYRMPTTKVDSVELPPPQVIS